MRTFSFWAAVAAFTSLASSTILQNGQVRETNYPNTIFNGSTSDFKTYPPTARQISYKGRWDSKYISWWSAPGLRFGFTGQEVAITFGPYTSDGVLVAYRIDGQDWELTNITTNATHLLVSPSTPGINLTSPINPSTFELRVTNWAYGVQIDSVHVSKDCKIITIPEFDRRIEFIGDSLSSGYTDTLEGLSSYAYGLVAGLGATEYSLTAYPGICLFDKECWGNLRGQFYQWFYTSDTSGRATEIWGDEPELWDFKKQQAADIVVFNIGTNDNNAVNNVSTAGYVAQYTMLIEGVHAIWPEAQIILIGLWEGFGAVGNTYVQSTLTSNVGYVSEIYGIYEYFNSPEYLSAPVLYNHTSNSTYTTHPHSPIQPFVHYFNTTGILDHNDIGPQYHPTDFGHLKLASHLMQFVKMTFGWEFMTYGPEIFHQTLYWNDQTSY